MERLSKSTEAAVLAVSYIVLVAANALGEVLRFGGTTSAEVSNEVFAWFAPAGYVFTIWSVIYIGLIVWIVRLVRDDKRDRALPFLPVSAEAALFAVSCALNIVWLALWHLRVFPATIVVIIALLAVVAALYLMTWRRSNSPLDRVPLALYASWLVVAVIANIAHVITRATPADAGIVPAVTTFALLVVLVAAVYVVHRFFDDYVFGIVVAWAGIGIGVRLTSVSPVIGVAIIVISTVGVVAALLPWDRITIGQAAKGASSRRRAR